mmetsp:Transcript_9512/g.58029  ORF Transcript_9512/g.58029 Transcript_9512/m.58029 type:complete len:178 (+) Transcript_9512:897-1430(+)
MPQPRKGLTTQILVARNTKITNLQHLPKVSNQGASSASAPTMQKKCKGDMPCQADGLACLRQLHREALPLRLDWQSLDGKHRFAALHLNLGQTPRGVHGPAKQIWFRPHIVQSSGHTGSVHLVQLAVAFERQGFAQPGCARRRLLLEGRKVWEAKALVSPFLDHRCYCIRGIEHVSA